VIDRLGGRPIGSGLTYSGHPLACACAVATIEALRDERLVERAAETGDMLGSGLAALAEAHPAIGEVRGLGAFWGIELVRNRESKKPLVPFDARGAAAEPVEALLRAALRRGLYLLAHWNVLLVCPPLTISHDECEEGLELLDEVLDLADGYYG
jgi:taurine--2-oxoglutarate transaminase